VENFCLKNIWSRLGDEESHFWFETRLCYSLTGDMGRMIHTIKKEMIGDSIEKFLKIEKDFFIFGAGYVGHSVVSNTPEISWRAFIDNDESKAGKTDVLPIISFQEFIANSKNAVVFIASTVYGDEMKRQLRNNGFPEDSIIQNIGVQYFDLPYFKPQENEFFVDAGGYDGKTAESFFQWLRMMNRTEGNSVTFEPDPIQYDVCKNKLQGYDNVKIVNKGLWHKSETLKFHKNLGASSRIASDGEETIETVSLDEYFKDEKRQVTFIKMDIEGAELNALKGAERIIKEQKPKLAICIYHKPEDVWEISNLLLDFVPDYKFYIRHYSLLNNETVLYAMLDQHCSIGNKF